MWPAVPVMAWASMLPRASKTAAERSPTSRTMGVKEVRMSAAACSLATAIRRLQRISRVTGSSSAIDPHHQVAGGVQLGPAPGADDRRRLPLLDHGRPLHHLPRPEPVAVEDAGLDETPPLLRPDRAPALEGRPGERLPHRRRRRAGPADPQPPGQDLDRDPGGPTPVEGSVALVEGGLDLGRRDPVQSLAEGDVEGIALAAVAHVDPYLHPHRRFGDPGPTQPLRPLP